MPSLKALKTRIDSVKSTRKITTAMKLVATSYYRKYQGSLEPIRLMHQTLDHCLDLTLSELPLESTPPALIRGRGSQKNHLFLVVGAMRGLCGSFNVRITNYAKQKIQEQEDRGQTVQVLCMGQRLYASMRAGLKSHQVTYMPLDYKHLSFNAEVLAEYLMARFTKKEIDACTVIYAAHESALSFDVRPLKLFPYEAPERQSDDSLEPIFGVEPDPLSLAEDLMHQKIQQGLLMAITESKASEESTRMIAMENASKNADDMIAHLNKTYNRTRQADITKELIEIISGAEAI